MFIGSVEVPSIRQGQEAIRYAGVFYQYNPDDTQSCAVSQDSLRSLGPRPPELRCMKFRYSDYARLPYLPEIGGAAWRPIEIPVVRFPGHSSSGASVQRSTPSSNESLREPGHVAAASPKNPLQQKGAKSGGSLRKLGHVTDQSLEDGPQRGAPQSDSSLRELGHVVDSSPKHSPQRSVNQDNNSLRELGHVTKRWSDGLESEKCERTAIPALYFYEYEGESENNTNCTVWALKFEDDAHFEAFNNYETTPINASSLLDLPSSVQARGSQRPPVASKTSSSSIDGSCTVTPIHSPGAQHSRSITNASDSRSKQMQYLAILKRFGAMPFSSFEEAERHVFGNLDRA